MSLRIATFNVENLMHRFDYSGFRNQLNRDRTLSIYEIKDEATYRALEAARAISETDDTRQHCALAIAHARADIICLQEVDSIESLNAFEYGYLFKMVGQGYRQKYTTTGNDQRGIDVGIMLREETADGQPVEFVRMTSHAHHTYEEFGLWEPELAELNEKPYERIFRRDCLEIDVKIGGLPLTVYVVHLKSMGSPRNNMTGREATMGIRIAEAKAIRRIIEDRFGKDRAADKRWIICGDFNDYQERVLIGGDMFSGFTYEPVQEESPCLDVLLADGFAENLVQRRPEMDRWTLFHSRGPQERHLCQLDYILASGEMAKRNAKAVPDIIRGGQPHRTPFPPGQEVERYPRIGWDRPKASDHCPVAVTLDIV